MNDFILHKDVQEFILKNLHSDLSKVILKGSPFVTVSIQEIANQIVGKQKAKEKLPTWFRTKNIYFPPKLNLEQTSSEKTAEYKSSFFSGQNCLDLTGGFGIDTFYLSKRFLRVVHCEINKEISEISEHNAKQLKASNIDFVQGNGIDYISTTKTKFDLIYIDPSRRNDQKGKVFFLEDCIPNIPENLDFLLNYSNRILIKYSPMLDIQKAISSLKFVSEVHVVAVENDVKELLFFIEKEFEDEIVYKTINFTKENKETFDFYKTQFLEINYSLPLNYLYEPNAAILKSGAFQEVAERYNVNKIHLNSHLYTSEELIDFPGRTFKIQGIYDFNKKTIQKLMNRKVNVTTRNFPLSVNEIRKKMKLKNGGDNYLFFTTKLEGTRIVIDTQKVKLN